VLLTIGMLNTLNLGPIGVSATPPPPEYPSVYVNFTASENPQEYLDAYAVPPTIITVEIWTDYSDGENITAYQFSLTWNPSVLEGLEVINNGSLIEEYWIPPPPFPPDPVQLHQFVNGTFDNTAGSLSATYAYFETSGEVDKNGPGKLATVTFKVVGIGDTDIILGEDTLLWGWNSATEQTYKIVNGVTMPFHLGHGYFANDVPIHDVAVNAVRANETEVVQGADVEIQVDVANVGTVPETFDVTVWTGLLELETRTVTMANGTADTEIFIWETAGMAVQTYTISAVASTVMGEVFTDNNALSGPDVAVTPVLQAIIIAPDAVELGTPVLFDGTASQGSGLTYFWDLGETHTGQPTTATTPTVEHTYKWPGSYGATLIVTDDQNRTSVPAYHLILVYEQRNVKLVNYQARPEKHKWVNSTDADGYVNVTALVKNIGNETIRVAVTVTILDKYGEPQDPIPADMEERWIAVDVKETFELAVDPHDYWDGEEKKVLYGIVQVLYDSTGDGILDAVGDTKNIRFSVDE